MIEAKEVYILLLVACENKGLSMLLKVKQTTCAITNVSGINESV